MVRQKRNPHVGSSFESYLVEEGQLRSATARARLNLRGMNLLPLAGNERRCRPGKS
jgi:hypothetical protein